MHPNTPSQWLSLCTKQKARFCWLTELTWNTRIQTKVFLLLVSREHKGMSDEVSWAAVWVPDVAEGTGSFLWVDARSRVFYTGVHLKRITFPSSQSDCRLFRVTLPGSARRTYRVTLKSSTCAVQNQNSFRLWSPKHTNLSWLLQTLVLFLQTTRSLCSPYISGAEPSKRLTVGKLAHK